MRYMVSALILVITAAPFASAQSSQTPLRLTVDEAVRLALENNVDLAADRLDPQISDLRVAAAAGAFRPALNSTVQRNNQLQPPTSFLIPTPTRNDVMTSNVGVSQRLPWFGTSYSIGWDTSHTNSDSFLNSYNPLLRSGLSLNVSQPLLRDVALDAPRAQVQISQNNRDVAGIRLSDSIVHTTAAVKTAYWNLVSARATVEARQTSLQLSQELTRVNKAKVDVGQSPPLDLLSAQAEVAANREQLIVAETTVHQAEDRLRLLIFDATRREVWNMDIEPVDAPPTETVAIDVDAAVTAALRDRGDLRRSHKDVETSKISAKLAGNMRLPDIRANAAYQASGLGGTEVLRTGGFPGTIVGPGNVTGFGNILDQLASSNYPTWAVGFTISYPLGRSTEEANYARATLETKQAEQRVKSAEARAIQQVRDAGWKVDMNAKRIDTTRANRQLAEQRLDAEQKRFEVGMSTSFLVIQAQRDLSQARTNEVSAILAYDLALVDFESLQQAGPAQSVGDAAATTAASAGATTALSTAAAAQRPTSTGAGAVSGLPAGIF
jgi:outer membrane protein TolC